MVTTLRDVHLEHPRPGTAVAVFSGEHDLATKGEVQALLTSLLDHHDLVVADFSSAEFIDSSILHVVLETDKQARERQRTFRLQLGTADIVRVAIKASGLEKVFDIAPTREAALGERP